MDKLPEVLQDKINKYISPNICVKLQIPDVDLSQIEKIYRDYYSVMENEDSEDDDLDEEEHYEKYYEKEAKNFIKNFDFGNIFRSSSNALKSVKMLDLFSVIEYKNFNDNKRHICIISDIIIDLVSLSSVLRGSTLKPINQKVIYPYYMGDIVHEKKYKKKSIIIGFDENQIVLSNGHRYEDDDIDNIKKVGHTEIYKLVNNILPHIIITKKYFFLNFMNFLIKTKMSLCSFIRRRSYPKFNKIYFFNLLSNKILQEYCLEIDDNYKMSIYQTKNKYEILRDFVVS